MTTYTEAHATDHDVALFMAKHPYDFNLFTPPVKYWVAREAGAIVAVLTLNTQPYLCLDLLVAKPSTRPFMRIVKLWKLAERWLQSQHVPVICASILDTSVHFQDMVQRYGFVKVGVENNIYGQPVETIFAKDLRGGHRHGDSTHSTL